MSYAIIGLGKIGHALAKAFARNGIEVSVATTRDPESFASDAAAIGRPRFLANQTRRAFGRWPAGPSARQYVGSTDLPRLGHVRLINRDRARSSDLTQAAADHRADPGHRSRSRLPLSYPARVDTDSDTSPCSCSDLPGSVSPPPAGSARYRKSYRWYW